MQGKQEGKTGQEPSKQTETAQDKQKNGDPKYHRWPLAVNLTLLFYLVASDACVLHLHMSKFPYHCFPARPSAV